MKKKSSNEIDWQSLVLKVLKDKCLSQKELAEICGAAQQTVSNWVVGTRIPSYASRRKILELADRLPSEHEENYPPHKARLLQLKEEHGEYEKFIEYDKFIAYISEIAKKLSAGDRVEVVKFALFRLKMRT